MKRIPELDGLRGLAALAVVVYHTASDAFPVGWMAVDLFFVLSGYLITAIILRDGGAPGFFATFYARRSLRLIPAYALCLALAWGLGSTNLDLPPSALYLAYLQNVPNYWRPGWPVWYEVGHTWSLAVEEQFYLVWPALVLLVGGRRVPLVAALAVALAISARAAGWHTQLLLTRSDGLALGAWLAAAELKGDFPRRARRLATLGLIVAAGASIWGLSRHHRPFGPYRAYDLGPECLVASFGSLAFLALILIRQGSPSLAWLRWPPLIRLGTISYGIYLSHWPIFVYVAKPLAPFVPGRWQAAYLIVPPLSVLAAELSWRLVERPILALKGRLGYRPAVEVIRRSAS